MESPRHYIGVDLFTGINEIALQCVANFTRFPSIIIIMQEMAYVKLYYILNLS